MSQQSLFYQSSTCSVSSACNFWEERPLLPVLNKQTSPLVWSEPCPCGWQQSIPVRFCGLFPAPRAHITWAAGEDPVSSTVDGPEAEPNSSKCFSEHDWCKSWKTPSFPLFMILSTQLCAVIHSISWILLSVLWSFPIWLLHLPIPKSNEPQMLSCELT